MIKEYLIHSVVDVITNSSTEFYVSAHKNSTTIFKSIIDDILRMGGSELTAEDLFVVSVVKHEDYGDEYGLMKLVLHAKDDKHAVTIKSLSRKLDSLFTAVEVGEG